MKIQVLGSGCPTCKKFYELTQSVISTFDFPNQLEYIVGIEGTQKIIELGVMSSPVLVVDNQIALIGFTPDTEKIKRAILSKLK
jgi:rRNA processing protein Krr1/Pno1